MVSDINQQLAQQINVHIGMLVRQGPDVVDDLAEDEMGVQLGWRRRRKIERHVFSTVLAQEWEFFSEKGRLSILDAGKDKGEREGDAGNAGKIRNAGNAGNAGNAIAQGSSMPGELEA
jgi:hypothetical protein